MQYDLGRVAFSHPHEPPPPPSLPTASPPPFCLDLLIGGETSSGRGCFVGNRFGDSSHSEFFPSIPP
uniref:Uncharacterized protein n=1 Tax=Fagus sylvatica TaxID=28930 RepID=A0A2N9GFB2_FAGSY